MPFGTMPLHDKIRAIRRSKHMKQTQFAKALGVSQGTVSRWENSKNPEEPTNESMAKIAEFGGVTVDELLDLAPARERGITQVRRVGAILAGGAVEFYDESGPNVYVAGFEGAPANTVALIINEETAPEGLEGWLVYFDEMDTDITPQVLNRMCVVWLDDGRVLIRKVVPGQIAGTYTLKSTFLPPIYDAKIRRVARVSYMKPGD
jgi:transcriptional regulator with XRE-family HTH domain